ncbi:MAG: YutD-like domain-containing protein [Candidatus Izemoplasmataceae bacterium]|jgi:uncharacterized protein YutD|uniref:YutD-like domain-containing protein n=1 Tax=Liberiplasma polymorphum TaxID=3374570 RepID=UPI003771046B
MLETAHGNFEIIKDYKEALDVKTFNDRYVEYLDKYDYIVGDVSAEMLRLKGFSKDTMHMIQDYLMESATPNCAYFILKRLPVETK